MSQHTFTPPIEAAISTLPELLKLLGNLHPAIGALLDDYRTEAEGVAETWLRKLLAATLTPVVHITATGDAPIANIEK